jgi:CheY-like chemotaxis protein
VAHTLGRHAFAMSPPVRLALLGFTPFESDHIRASLGPGVGDPVAYVQADDLASSSLALVNADHEPSVAEVQRQRRLSSSVMLGTQARPGAAAQLGRPFNGTALRRTLDALALATPPVSERVQRVQQELTRLGGSRFVHPPAAPRRERPTGAMPLIQGPARTQGQRALVIDESDVLMRSLAAQTRAENWNWQLARSAAEALECVSSWRPHRVFIATGLDSLDGFHTCRMVRHGSRPAELRPEVVLVLAQDGAVDRLRAQLAGADHTLTLPLDRNALLEVLASHAAESPLSGTVEADF